MPFALDASERTPHALSGGTGESEAAAAMPDFVSSTGGGTGVGAAASAKGHELKRDQESLPLLFIEFLALEGVF